MYGDKLLICDMASKQFFAGWKQHQKRFSEEMPIPIWSKTVDGARKTRALASMQRIVKMLGNRTQVISETRARQIETIEWCKKSEYSKCVSGE